MASVPAHRRRDAPWFAARATRTWYVDSLALAIPADRHTIFGVDSDSALINRVLASTSDAAATLHWLSRIYLVNEPTLELSFLGLMGLGTPAVVIRETIDSSWGIPQERFFPLSSTNYEQTYRELGAPAGGILRGFFSADGRWVAALDAIRSSPRHPFSPSDRSFVRLLAPHIGRGVAVALRAERAVAVGDDVSPTASGVLILDRHDRVIFHTPAAIQWIELLRDTWQSESPGKVQLPTAVWTAVGRVRAPYDAPAQQSVRVESRRGALHVEASPGSEPETVAVVLTPEHTARPPALPADWPLTKAERQVVMLLAHGMSNRRIAATLTVAEKTIETHLSHVYEKVGVRNRVELLARLFQQTYLPALELQEDQDM